MDKNLNFEVGDIVRVFTEKEVEAFVEAGGDDFNLLLWERRDHDTALGKVRKIADVYRLSVIGLECEKGEHNYCYPPEILELVKDVNLE